MIYRWLADVVLAAHLAFVIFVLLGGLLVLRRPRVAWVHVPAAIWGILTEYAGLICPLTPLEVALQRRGGGAGYEEGFIEHYLIAVLYPAGLTRSLQFGLGTLALVVNVAIYARVFARRGRQAGAGTSGKMS